MKSRKQLLNSLLKALLAEWGTDEVRSSLEKAIAEHASERSQWSFRSDSPRVERATALQLVDRLEVQKNVKQPLRILATRFDQKDFLPSIADVREFIIMAGQRPPAIKNRQESFRNLLRILLDLSPERLQQMAEAANHAGPAQLGPISDAIAAAGERLPRRNHEPE
ncbi:hypothetical protein [Novosphingobium sp. FSW06-99]|uniref:hypothetical protein n=1 Tax=Novosphingobium sp. FSW06-99 TaxID=1739113 RepID=UPI0012E3BE58|nr:hypothetical protein [Novosphingobium sp. FSW06-99]